MHARCDCDLICQADFLRTVRTAVLHLTVIGCHARLMLRMASDAEWPVNRRDESDVHELLDGPDFRVEEELRGRVKELYENARA